MTLPVYAPISLSAIKTEFAAGSLSDAGQAAFGRANCNMLEFLGLSNRVTITVDYSGGGTIFNATPKNDTAYHSGGSYVAGRTTFNVIVGVNIFSTGFDPAFYVSGLSSGDIMNITISGGTGIYGMGGFGGIGADNTNQFNSPTYGGDGGGGGTAMYFASQPGVSINITNNGFIGGGGGGGGGNAGYTNNINNYGVCCRCGTEYHGGDGGGGGAGGSYIGGGGQQIGGTGGVGGGITETRQPRQVELFQGGPGGNGGLTVGAYLGTAGGNIGQDGPDGPFNNPGIGYAGLGGPKGNATVGFANVSSYGGSGGFAGALN